jgi:hypothetical protein
MTPKTLDMLVKTIQSNFSRRTDGIVEFTRDTYPGRWRLTHLAALAKPSE